MLPYLKARGTELQGLRLADQLIRRGWRVRLVVVQGWGLPQMFEAFAACGATVESLGPPDRPGCKALSWWRWPRLVWQLRQEPAQVVLSRAGMTNRFACLAALAAGRPSVAVLSTAVAPPLGPPSRPWLGALRRLSLGWPSRIVAVSNQSLTHLQAAFPALAPISCAIANGVADRPLLPPRSSELAVVAFSRDRFHLCAVGSLEMGRKGLDVLLQAIALLRQRGEQDLLLSLIGTGEDQQALQQLAQRLRIEPQLRFLGECSHPQALVAQADLYVLPSRREGLPNALLEAMAVGVCALAADCPTGPAEIIRDGYTGMLVPVGDAEALAEGIAQLKRDPGLRQRLAQAGQRSVAARFSPERCAEDYHRLLTSLLP